MKVLRRMFAIAFLALASITAQADLGPLIPRDVLFGNPERAAPRISPDAKRLAWLAPDKKNVLQVWVRTIGQNDDKMVTADKKRGIRQYFWASDSKTLLYLQDNDGDENFHAYGVDLESGVVRATGVRSSNARRFEARARAATFSSEDTRVFSIAAPAVHRAATAPMISLQYRTGSAA